MLTSSLQNTTILYAQLALMTTSVSTRKISNPVDSELSSLISAIKSGNTAEAQGSLADLQMMGQTNVNPGSALGVFLATVSAALSSYNINGAQKALGVFEASSAPRVPPVEPASALMLAPSAPSGPGVGTVGPDLLNLLSAIHSGDAASAQSAYGTLSNLMESSGGQLWQSLRQQRGERLALQPDGADRCGAEHRQPDPRAIHHGSIHAESL